MMKNERTPDEWYHILHLTQFALEGSASDAYYHIDRLVKMDETSPDKRIPLRIKEQLVLLLEKYPQDPRPPLSEEEQKAFMENMFEDIGTTVGLACRETEKDFGMREGELKISGCIVTEGTKKPFKLK